MEQLFIPPHKKWLYLYIILTFLFGLMTIIFVILGKHRDNALFIALPFMLTALSMYHSMEYLRRARIAIYKNELFNLLLERPRSIFISDRRIVLDEKMLGTHGIEHKKYRILSQRDFIEVVAAIKRRQLNNE